MLRKSFALMLLAAALAPGEASAQTDISSCTSGNGEAGITACSRFLLKGEGYSKEERAQMYSQRGFLISLVRRNYREAEKDYTRAIELSGAESVSYLFHLNGRCRMRAFGNFELLEGLEDCNKALGNPNGTGIDVLTRQSFLYSRAFIFVRLNRLEDALTDLDTAIGQQSRSTLSTLASWALRGIVHRRMGNTVLAEKNFLQSYGTENGLRKHYGIH